MLRKDKTKNKKHFPLELFRQESLDLNSPLHTPCVFHIVCYDYYLIININLNLITLI